MLVIELIIIPAIMQQILDREIESTSPEVSQRSGIIERTGKAVNKLGIVVATAAALHGPLLAQNAPSANSSPSATLQATKGLGQVVEIGGKKMSFAEIAALPETEKDDLLSNLKVSQQARFQEWQLLAANQTESKIDGNIQAANQTERKVDGNIQAANQRIESKKEALELSKQLEITLDEVFGEQWLNKVTPEIVVKNKKRWAIILSALANPLIGWKLPLSSQEMLKILWDSLVAWNSSAFASQRMANTMKAEIKNIQ